MDYMHGSLRNLIKKTDINSILKIIKLVAGYFKCLSEKGYSYTDVKTGNILYKCNNGKIKISLGDVGSICEMGEQGTCTYPPAETLIEKRVVCNEMSMVWGLGILMLELLGLNMSKLFYHQEFKKYFKNIDLFATNVNKQINAVSEYYKLFNIKLESSLFLNGDVDIFLRGLLMIDPSKRLTLSDILVILENI
jgi:serine/threonine protein kinase